MADDDDIIYDGKTLGSYHAADLKGYLKEAGQPVSGTKATLITRFAEFLREKGMVNNAAQPNAVNVQSAVPASAVAGYGAESASTTAEGAVYDGQRNIQAAFPNQTAPGGVNVAQDAGNSEQMRAYAEYLRQQLQPQQQQQQLLRQLQQQQQAQFLQPAEAFITVPYDVAENSCTVQQTAEQPSRESDIGFNEQASYQQLNGLRNAIDQVEFNLPAQNMDRSREIVTEYGENALSDHVAVTEQTSLVPNEPHRSSASQKSQLAEMESNDTPSTFRYTADAEAVGSKTQRAAEIMQSEAAVAAGDSLPASRTDAKRKLNPGADGLETDQVGRHAELVDSSAVASAPVTAQLTKPIKLRRTDRHASPLVDSAAVADRSQTLTLPAEKVEEVEVAVEKQEQQDEESETAPEEIGDSAAQTMTTAAATVIPNVAVFTHGDSDAGNDELLGSAADFMLTRSLMQPFTADQLIEQHDRITKGDENAWRAPSGIVVETIADVLEKLPEHSAEGVAADEALLHVNSQQNDGDGGVAGDEGSADDPYEFVYNDEDDGIDDELTLAADEQEHGVGDDEELDDLRELGEISVEELRRRFGYDTGPNVVNTDDDSVTKAADVVRRDVILSETNEVENLSSKMQSEFEPNSTIVECEDTADVGTVEGNDGEGNNNADDANVDNDDEDEDDDENADKDYVPPQKPSEIRHGTEYQAAVNDCARDASTLNDYYQSLAEINYEHAQWKPKASVDDELIIAYQMAAMKQYLLFSEYGTMNERIRAISDLSPFIQHVLQNPPNPFEPFPDHEDLLHQLMKSTHNLRVGLQRCFIERLPRQDSSLGWLDEETQRFEEALLRCDKDFLAIARHVKSRSVRECVHYYYERKRTARYERHAKPPTLTSLYMTSPTPVGGSLLGSATAACANNNNIYSQRLRNATVNVPCYRQQQQHGLLFGVNMQYSPPSLPSAASSASSSSSAFDNNRRSINKYAAYSSVDAVSSSSAMPYYKSATSTRGSFPSRQPYVNTTNSSITAQQQPFRPLTNAVSSQQQQQQQAAYRRNVNNAHLHEHHHHHHHQTMNQVSHRPFSLPAGLNPIHHSHELTESSANAVARQSNNSNVRHFGASRTASELPSFQSSSGEFSATNIQQHHQSRNMNIGSSVSAVKPVASKFFAPSSPVTSTASLSSLIPQSHQQQQHYSLGSMSGYRSASTRSASLGSAFGVAPNAMASSVEQHYSPTSSSRVQFSAEKMAAVFKPVTKFFGSSPIQSNNNAVNNAVAMNTLGLAMGQADRGVAGGRRTQQQHFRPKEQQQQHLVPSAVNNNSATFPKGPSAVSTSTTLISAPPPKTVAYGDSGPSNNKPGVTTSASANHFV